MKVLRVACWACNNLSMRKSTSPAARTIACPKCAGTGIVSRFLDYKSGECFDCNGTGRMARVVASRKFIRVTPATAQAGTVVRVSTGMVTETITATAPLFLDNGQVVGVTVTTDAGNEYPVHRTFPSNLVLA